MGNTIGSNNGLAYSAQFSGPVGGPLRWTPPTPEAAQSPADQSRFRTEVAPPTVDIYKSEFETEASLSSRQAGTSYCTQDGDVSMEGGVALGQAARSYEASVSANPRDGLQAELSGEAGLYAVSGEGKFSVGSDLGTTTGEASAQVGAAVGGNAEVTFNPLGGDVAATVGADGFLGARVGAEVSHTAGPLGASAGIEGFAGVGAELEVDFGLKDGTLSAQFDIGAALILGGSLEFGVSVDAAAIGNSVVDGAKSLFSGWSWPAGDSNPTTSGW
jgi:hypothetical protein